MNIQEQIFKAYDLRGVYPEEINEDFAYNFGLTFATFLLREKNKESLRICVSRDGRLSSPALAEKIIAGLLDGGCDVFDIGIASTPTFYFAVGNNDYDGGVQVSASHNPKQYNGFKMVREKAIPISQDTGIMVMKEMMKNDDFVKKDKPGNLSTVTNILEEQIKYELGFVDINKLAPYKIVIDAANSVGALMFQEAFKYLPGELIPLNFNLDGTFPSHEADPLKDENNTQLKNKVLAEKADFGIGLDGDADRIFFVTNEGITIEPAIIRGILSKIFLRGHAGANVCYDIRPGQITIDMIEEAGGVPVVTKVGHSLIKEKARLVGAIFAGESSGHFFLDTPKGIYEMPLVFTLKIWAELSASGQTFAEYVKPLYKYFHSGEINMNVADKLGVFDALKEKYGANLQYDFDGLSFKWDDWWFNIRASNTENKIRLNLEAVSEEIMKNKRDEVLALLKTFSQ